MGRVSSRLEGVRREGKVRAKALRRVVRRESGIVGVSLEVSSALEEG